MPVLRSLRNRAVLSDKSNQVLNADKSSENSFNEVVKIGKVLSSYAKSKPLRKNENIPIWNRKLIPSKPKSVKKNSKKFDVYDISFDEEMSCEVVKVKGKVKKCIKTSVKKLYKKRCLPRSDECTKKLDKEVLPTKSNVNIQAVEKTDQKSSNINECINNLVEKEVQDSFPDTIASDTVIPEENMDVENSSVITESIDDHTFLLHLADELEKSILVPKMTSTPTEIKVNPQRSNASNSNKSKIVYDASLEKTVLTQENLLVKDIDKDITLFESPTKEKKKQKQGKINFKPSKNFIQFDLYDEFPETPSSPPKLNDTVIKPKKAYHTPDNFKNHLARTKRISLENIRVSKSKEDIIIEKMSQHFEEVGGTELCVE